MVKQLFAGRHLCDEIKKVTYIAFLDVEKAYDHVNKAAFSQVIEIFRVGQEFNAVIKSFHEQVTAYRRYM